MRKILTLIAALSLVASLAIGGTIAYLQDSDSQINTMTMGNVEIEQLEYERVVENGAYVSTNNVDDYGLTPQEIQPFTQAKPLYPAYYSTDIVDYEQDQSWGAVEAPGSSYLFGGELMKGVQDKFVFVKNTGSSDAYVRTIFAFEQGNLPVEKWEEVVKTNANEKQWVWNVDSEVESVEIDDNKYIIACAYYLGKSSEPAYKLAGNSVSYPSLLQIYMNKEATNEDVKALDGNGNGLFDVLVLTQAMQTENMVFTAEQLAEVQLVGKTENDKETAAPGLAAEKLALDVGFGKFTDANIAAWFEAEDKLPVTSVATYEDLAAAIAEGGTVVLTADIEVPENTTVTVPSGESATINLAGHTISADNTRTGTHNDLFLVKGTLNVTGGTVEYEHTGTNMGWNGCINAFDVTAGGVLNLDGVTVKASGTDMNFAVHLNNWGEVTLNADNCVFDSDYCGVRVFNSGYDMNNVKITNSTLKGASRAFWVHNYIGDLNSASHSDEAIKARLNLDIFGNDNTFEITGTAKSPVRYGFNIDVFIDPKTGAEIE